MICNRSGIFFDFFISKLDAEINNIVEANAYVYTFTPQVGGNPGNFKAHQTEHKSRVDPKSKPT